MEKISVIICTYNRVDLLPGAIRSLHEQDLPGKLFKIIVVDNGSTDQTREVAQPCCDKHKLVYVFEPRKGAGFARNAGAACANTEYVAFMDDDARADKEWLKNILYAFETLSSRPAAVGGAIYPYYEQTPPGWFKDAYEIRSWGNEARLLRPKEHLSGSNMAFRREVFLKFGEAANNYGPAGNTLSLGEDTILFLQMWQSAKEALPIYYSPHIKVTHLVPEKKMAVRYILKRHFIHGKVWVRQAGPKNISERTAWVLLTPFEVVRLASLALMKIKKFACWQQWAVEGFSTLAARLGSAVGLFVR